MTKRRNQTSQDISDLAERFRAAWNDGQVLRSWLKTHGPEILELSKHGNWSWDNLGKALTEAGITYQTGTPWTGENLRRNLRRTQIPGKRELKLLRMAAVEPAATPVNTQAAPDLSAGIAERQTPALPEFQLIRRAVDIGKAPVEAVRLPPKKPRPVLTEEEIDAIAIGRSARR
jgi:hypothetical protein